MKNALLLVCGLIAGCDAVRSTTERMFSGAPTESEAIPAVAEPAEKIPVPVVSNIGWVGAKKSITGLGDPNTPGRWLQTPLVKTEINGRVVVPRTGAQTYVALVPAPGPEGGGSRLSIEAMRALLIPFDELVELDVYSD